MQKMDRNKSFRVFVIYAIILQFMILAAQNSYIKSTKSSDIKNYIARDAAVQVQVDFVSANYSTYSDMSFRGSGGVIAMQDDTAYVLTARHVCQPLTTPELEILDLQQKIEVVDSAGEVNQANISLLSAIFDLCILEFETNKQYITIPISDDGLYLDEKAYMYAAPSGFFAADVVPLFEGFYAGDVYDGYIPASAYTIPAVGGSSGGLILNSDGEVVGVLHSALVDFHHITLSTRHSDVIDFLHEFQVESGIMLL
jgi:hypothetical protein